MREKVDESVVFVDIVNYFLIIFCTYKIITLILRDFLI